MSRIVIYLIGLLGVGLIVIVSLSSLDFYLRGQAVPTAPSVITKQLTWVPDASMSPGARTLTVVADDGRGSTITKDITIALLPPVVVPSPSPSPSPELVPTPFPTLSPAPSLPPSPTSTPTPNQTPSSMPTLIPTPSLGPGPGLLEASIVLESQYYNAKPGETIDIPITVTVRGHGLSALLERAMLILFDPSPTLQIFNPLFVE